jgi:TolA-binding protein
MHAAMFRTIYKVLLSLAIVLLAKPILSAQQSDSSSIVSLYQKARANYAERQFQKSAIEFLSVAERCPGSELAIQCEYFAAMSEWGIEPCDGCAAKLANWLEKASKFQDEAVAKGRAYDAKQLLRWTENAELVHAKWDRQKLRIDLAEQRLKAFLEHRKGQHAPVGFSQSWLELGSLLLEVRHDFAAAQSCFENALRDPGVSEATLCQAKFGQALAQFNSQQIANSRSNLEELLAKQLSEDLRVQATLLRIKVAKSLGESMDVLQTLEPVIRLALAGNPQSATIYELAMALVEAGESARANEMLLQIVHRFPNSPVSIESRVRLARSAVENKQWKEAVDWSDQAIREGCPKELSPFAYLLRGQAKLELGATEQARLDFETALHNTTGDLQLEISIRFQLAESLYQLQRWNEAETYWQWLVRTAQQAAKEVGKPDWYPVVLLRTAELLALRKEWDQAEEIVLRIRNDFPKCKRACEVDYLLARCLVSKADFDTARQVLQSITLRTIPTPDELVARGHWMVGETYLMQRNFPDALIAYREAQKIPNQNYWNSAALLQIAKCCEATQDMQGAKQAYESLINQFSTSPFVSTAQERLKTISSASIADRPSKEPTSGTKR